MKFKKFKIIPVLFVCVMLCICLVGCGGSNSSKKINVNTLASTMTLTKVSYYDFYNDVYVQSYSGKCSVISNTLTSTEIWFIDANGNTRVACVNTALSQKPSTVKVYTNSQKTTYDTYTCTY